MAAASSESLIARRYARAFFELAVDQQKLDTVAHDLAALAVAVQDSAPLRRMIANPLLSRAVQGKAMQAICEKAGFDPLTQNFIGVLAANRRLSALLDIIRAVQAEISAHKGEVVAEITSAVALSDAQVSALTDQLKKAVGADVSLALKTDETLIGGLMVKIGSKLIDGSVRTKISRLHRALRGQAHANELKSINVKEVA